MELREQIFNLKKTEHTNSYKKAIDSLQAELEHLYMDEEIYWR